MINFQKKKHQIEEKSTLLETEVKTEKQRIQAELKTSGNFFRRRIIDTIKTLEIYYIFIRTCLQSIAVCH